MLTYEESLDFLYGRRASYERQGASGYKPGLGNIEALCAALGHPERGLRCVHVAGTNGKGSVCSLLAATLQSAGLRTGLFTSPHLVDFGERVRIDGVMVPHDFVVDFVERLSHMEPGCEPTFFEMTTALAFDWFARQGVDVAVLETGLGGRLDSTNVVTPEVSVVTNISLDHTDLLGETLAEIAAEKAGIFKAGVPAVVGEAGLPEVRRVFERTAERLGCPLTVAGDAPEVTAAMETDGVLLLETRSFGTLRCGLMGDYQLHNASTALAAVMVLRGVGWSLPDAAVAEGFERVRQLTGLAGRWTTLATEPLTLCDAAHNEAGLRYVVRQLLSLRAPRLHFVLAFMADKDLAHILPLLPADAVYYFTQAPTPRSLDAVSLCSRAAAYGLHGTAFADPRRAYTAARCAARADGGVVYVGGSMYLIGQFLSGNASEA